MRGEEVRCCISVVIWAASVVLALMFIYPCGDVYVLDDPVSWFRIILHTFLLPSSLLTRSHQRTLSHSHLYWPAIRSVNPRGASHSFCHAHKGELKGGRNWLWPKIELSVFWGSEQNTEHMYCVITQILHNLCLCWPCRSHVLILWYRTPTTLT